MYSRIKLAAGVALAVALGRNLERECALESTMGNGVDCDAKSLEFEGGYKKMRQPRRSVALFGVQLLGHTMCFDPAGR